MSSQNSTLRLMVGVSVLLGVSLATTGFVTSKYRQEKLSLGRAHFDRGDALEKAADGNEAVEEFRKALIFCPDTAQYRMAFASALLQAGRLEEAESHINQLLQEDPTNGALNLMLGRIAEKRNQLAKAIDYYQRAVYEYWPPDKVAERRQARLELIELLGRAGRREELIAELMTLYANFPNDQALKARIGLDLLDHGATSEAVQVFKEMVRAAPKNADAHRGMAQAYFSSGDYVSARHEFERAVRLNSKDAIAARELKLTNAVIDLDPNLSGIREAERLRRAQNLLKRVMTDLQQCGDASSTADQLSKANSVLQSTPKEDEDLALEMQKEALDLWAQRSHICSGNPTSDGALATVLARMSNE